MDAVAAGQESTSDHPLPLRSIGANRGFARGMVAGHFGQADLVLGHPVRAGLQPAQSDPAGALLEDLARAEALPGHFERTGSFGAFELAAPGPEYLAKPARVHLPRAARARPVPMHRPQAAQARFAPVHLASPPKLQIASTGRRLL